MKLLTIWINMLIVMIAVLAALVLSALDIQLLLQWKLATIAALGILFSFLYKWRNSLRLDEPQVHIQLLDN